MGVMSSPETGSPVSIPKRGFGGFSPNLCIVRPTKGDVSIPKRGFGGFSLTIGVLCFNQIGVSIPKRGFGGFSQRCMPKPS